MGQTQPRRDRLGAIDPARAEGENLLGRTDPHEFTHAERLQTIGIARWLVPKAVRRDVENIALFRRWSPRGGDGIDRIARRRAQNEIGRARGAGPVIVCPGTVRGVENLPFGSTQGADAAEQLRKALEIAGVFELTSTHDRWKAEHLRPIRTFVRNRALQPLHDALIDGGAGVDA